MTTGLTGRQIRDKTIDGDDLKDSVTINPSGSAGGGLYVRGTGGYLLSASAGEGAVALSGSVSVTGGLLMSGADRLEVTGTVAATGGITGSLTRLADGTAYLRAGSGISIVSGSDGSVTVSAAGGGGGGMPDLSYILLNNAGPVFENERILAAGSGITITDAGPRGSVTISAPGAGGAVPATDGNHVYVYALDDAAGGTIANTGATSGGDLVVAGTPIFQSGRLSRSGRSILWPATASSDRAAGDVSSISGTGLTLEAFVSVLGVPHTFGVVLCVYTAGGDNVIINTHSTNGFYAQVLVGGSYANTYSTPVPVQYGRPTHVAMTWDLSTIRLYVDGFLRASAGCTLTPPAWDRISIANYGPTANSAFFGNIMQARVSDVARSSDYIMAAAEAAFKV